MRATGRGPGQRQDYGRFRGGRKPAMLLDGGDPHSLQALRARLYGKLDTLALFEAAIAVELDLRLVDEDVLGTVGTGDEAVALGSVEPFDGSLFSFRHVGVLLVVLAVDECHHGGKIIGGNKYVRGIKTATRRNAWWPLVAQTGTYFFLHKL